MAMRDLQRLEELGSSAALGLWADDIVLALDRAVNGGPPDETDADLLNDGADMVDEAVERTDHPLRAPSSRRALAATDGALEVVASLARGQGTNNADEANTERTVLTTIAATLRAAATRSLNATDQERIDEAASFFSKLGQLQLIHSNSVLGARKDLRGWTEMHTISSFF
jgi:hypothetical protein